MIEYFDSHAHYDDEIFKLDLSDVLKNAYNQGVTKIIAVGYDKASSINAISLANQKEYIYSTIGLHPENIENENIEESLKYIYELYKNEKKIVAIGEIGLDYYCNKENKELQKKYFKKQIEIANELNLPIIIHSRQADMDILQILKNEVKPKTNAVFHCFSSSLEIAKEVIKNGWNISLSGTVTFKNATNIHEVARYVPIEKLFIETDCPYLTPEPFRGQRNDSSKVIYVARKIAELKQMEENEVAKITYSNALNFYNIK